MDAGANLDPLAVDLDGTLLHIDTLHEGVFGAIKSDPKGTLKAMRRLGEGKAVVKRDIASRSDFDPASLPYNTDLLDYLRAQKDMGRRIGLFTAADQSIAEAIADHLGLFDVVRGSDGQTNLSGSRKLAQIRDDFGAAFVYAGDADVDKPMFEAASAVVLVGPVARLERLVPDGTPIEASFRTPLANLGIWAKALRIPHWAKNGLIFVAPMIGFEMLTWGIALNTVMLFVAFGMLASATYLLNDLLDLPADRNHPKKMFRPSHPAKSRRPTPWWSGSVWDWPHSVSPHSCRQWRWFL